MSRGGCGAGAGRIETAPASPAAGASPCRPARSNSPSPTPPAPRRWPSAAAEDAREVIGQQHLLGPGKPSRRLRVGAAALDDSLGPARHRQDDAGAADGRRLRRPIHRHVGGARRRQGHPRSGRAGAGGAGARPADGGLRRRGAPLQQEPAGRLPAARRVGPPDLHRRDHREPVVRGELGAALARHGACAAQPGGRRSRRAARAGALAARGAAADRSRRHPPDRLCRRRRPAPAQRLREPGRHGPRCERDRRTAARAGARRAAAPHDGRRAFRHLSALHRGARQRPDTRSTGSM